MNTHVDRKQHIKNKALVAGSKQPAPSKQLYNGFAILTVSLDNSNQVTRITENFYDLSTSSAVWTKDIYSGSHTR